MLLAAKMPSFVVYNIAMEIDLLPQGLRNKLTPQQLSLEQQYLDKWFKVGINTDRLDPEKTKDIISNFRQSVGHAVDKPLIIVDNPLEAWAAVRLLFVYRVELENLNDELDHLFRDNPKKYQIPPAKLPKIAGSFDVGKFVYYDYMINVMDIKLDPETLNTYRCWEATSQLGGVFLLPEYTVVIQKPIEIHLNENFVLHNDDGPALVYAGRGDLKIYAKNGKRYVPN